MRELCSAIFLLSSLTLVAACSGPDPAPPSITTPASTAAPAPASTPSAATGTGAASGSPDSRTSSGPSPAELPSAKPIRTTSAQPVPKVQRTGDPSGPTASAAPTSIDAKVRYPDGVSLAVRSVTFGAEKKTGPGSFPGRAYALMTLEISNQSAKKLSMATVVVTVLDKNGQPVAPVYSDEVDVEDFSGTVAAGKTVKAKYAFAVPKSSRSKVTVVVDFDGVHTSAVFRGKLG